MAKKLSQKQIDGMFKVWVERQSVNYVAKKCNVSHTTVEKYMALQDWRGRLAGIQEKAQGKQDDSLAVFLASRIKYVEFFVKKVVDAVRTGQIDITKDPASAITKLIDVELLLRGQVNSRMAIIDSKLKDVSTETLLKMREKIQQIANNAEQPDIEGESQ